MYKIAILGCENSHANSFLDLIYTKKEYPDIEVVGIYSEEAEAANKLSDAYGVYVAKSYDEFVGKIDGVVITARHGDNHYKYAKPYIESGIPMFLDKPVVISEEDAVNIKAELIKNNVKVCGGSSLKHALLIAELKKAVSEKTYGKVYGGYLRASLKMENPYGDFFFYAQHLVQMAGEVFGYNPISVKAYEMKGDVINCVLRYEDIDVNMAYVENNDDFYAGISCEKDCIMKQATLDGCFAREFAEFYGILTGGEQPQSYDEFFSVVYTMNAIERSLKSGNEETIIYK